MWCETQNKKKTGQLESSEIESISDEKAFS